MADKNSKRCYETLRDHKLGEVDFLRLGSADDELNSSDSFDLDLMDTDGYDKFRNVYNDVYKSPDGETEVDSEEDWTIYKEKHITEDLPDYESPIEDNEDPIIISSQDTSDDSNSGLMMKEIFSDESEYNHYVEADSYAGKTRKPKLGRSKPYYKKYDNSGSNNKGKQLLSGKSTVKSTSSSSSCVSQKSSHSPTFQQEIYADPGMYADEVKAPSLFCESCDSEQNPKNVAQCCDGHILCAQCVEKSTKRVLIDENKGSVYCPKLQCRSSLPLSELKKSLPAIVMDLLEEKWRKETVEALENMKDSVKCPDCGFLAVLDVGIKMFPCANCNKTFCRCCDKRWENKESHDMCVRTKQWTSVYNGNVIQIPEHWSYSTDNKIETLVEVDKKSGEFSSIVSFMHQQISVDVSKIYRIQNARLWEKYTLFKSHMVADLGELHINEKRLFHGTSKDVALSICKEGFDWRLCGKNGTAFGQGSYFAKSATMSHPFSARGKSRSHVGALKGQVPNSMFPSGFIFGPPNTSSTSGSVSQNSVNVFPNFGVPSTTNNSGSNVFNPFSIPANSSPLRFGAPQPMSSHVQASGISGSLLAATFGGSAPIISLANTNTNASNSLSVSSTGNKDVVDDGILTVKENECLMFLARVLVGRSCLGKSSMRRPEKNKKGETTQSAVNDVKNPTIFVIFDSSQCYPEYLIQYSMR